jgi:hypothetical protein
MLVELHGGRIHLQSTKGVGTVLRFFIVVERSTLPPLPPPTPLVEFPPPISGRSLDPEALVIPAPQLDDRRLRVLVVEVRLLSRLSHACPYHEYRTISSTNGC